MHRSIGRKADSIVRIEGVHVFLNNVAYVEVGKFERGEGGKDACLVHIGAQFAGRCVDVR